MYHTVPVPALDRRIPCGTCGGCGEVVIDLPVSNFSDTVDCWGCNSTGYARCAEQGCAEDATWHCADGLYCETHALGGEGSDHD